LADRSPIDLAHQTPFRLGGVTVNPPLRELVHDNGAREILEPRVMEVLVALARAGGEILTRDDLTTCCWGGRIVGEDAINRVISRLRRSAEGIGQGAFRLETITKVGYRLVSTDSADGMAAAGAVAGRREPPERPDRRLLLAGGAAAGAAALAAGGYLFLGSKPREPSKAVKAVYQQGWTAIGNAIPEQVAQGQGLFRQVVAADPEYADGWGSLAVSYSLGNQIGDPSQRAALQVQARSAAQRALQLDPDNALAEVAVSLLTPLYGGWAAREQVLEAASRRHRDAPFLHGERAWLYASVGRAGDAASVEVDGSAAASLTVISLFRKVLYLWAANRLEEANAAARTALETSGRSRPLWFTVFYFWMYTGRPEQALALIEDVASRPAGVDEDDFERVRAVAQAVRSRSQTDIDRAMDLSLRAARTARGYAENAIQFAAFLGRPDAAFEVADAYYFGRGFQLGPMSFERSMGQFYREPRTYFLFLPSIAPIHADPRFDRLVTEIGLKAYWAKSGRAPDYLASAKG
jgi:DNA-binding winged helix-turn-helix (wHTH) protein/tetratricopeptide (TPR) repeat protein